LLAFAAVYFAAHLPRLDLFVEKAELLIAAEKS